MLLDHQSLDTTTRSLRITRQYLATIRSPFALLPCGRARAPAYAGVPPCRRPSPLAHQRQRWASPVPHRGKSPYLPTRTTGFSTCENGWVRFAYPNRRQGNRVQTMTLDAEHVSAASWCRCYPAAACVSGIKASSPTGTKPVPCAAVGHCWASPPSPPALPTERVSLRSPVQENRTPGSVRGASGNWRPYRDAAEHTGNAPKTGKSPTTDGVVEIF